MDDGRRHAPHHPARRAPRRAKSYDERILPSASPGAREKVEKAVPVDATRADFDDANVALVTVPGTREHEVALEVRGPNGTTLVLTSTVSKSFPVSDAGLGAFTYLVELLSGFMGDPRRWRTMPWMVALFGFMVVPLGIVSVGLIMLQPVVVGAWCTACLLSALFMLIMIALSLDEVIAMLQFLMQTHRAGKSVWRAFWLGGDALGDNLTPRRPETEHPRQMFWGVTVPWNLLVSALLGAWLMVAPSVFQTQGQAAHSDQILGALVVTIAIIAVAEVTRAARFINIALALGIIVLPWLLGGVTVPSGINDLIIGVLIIALSIPPGKIMNAYGEWNSLIV